MAGRLVFRRHPPGSQSLIQVSDLTALGAFTLPDTNDLDYATGLTGRYIGAVSPANLRFYTFNYGGSLFELTQPGTYKTSAWDSATITYNFGDVFQNAIWNDVDTGGGGAGPPYEGLAEVVPVRLYIDPVADVLYSTLNVSYDNDFVVSPPAIIRSTLNHTLHTGVGEATWRLSPKSAKGNRWAFEVLPIPTTFANTYLSGRRLGVGSGGALSIISNSYSAGPALFAIDPPDVADDRDYISGGLSQLLYYPSASLGDDPGNGIYRAPRPAALPALHDFDAYPSTVWNWNDGFGGNTGVWINGPSKHGFIVFASLSSGNLDTTISASPTPTHTVFTVANIGDAVVGDLAQWDTDVTDVQAGSYDFCIGTITAIAGSQVTVGSIANGNGSGGSPGSPDITGALPTVGGRFYLGNFYMGGGQAHSRSYSVIMGYDPADLALVAAGSVTAQRVPYINEAFPLAGFSLPFPGGAVGSSMQGTPVGSWLDTNVTPPVLYVMHKGMTGVGHLVFAYEVDC